LALRQNAKQAFHYQHSTISHFAQGGGACFGLASNGNNSSMPIRNENETKQVSLIVRMVMRLVDQMAFGKVSDRPNDPAPKKSRDRIFDEREDLNDL
jgi:hypothetical protein